MNAFWNWPLSVRLALVFAVGAVAGSLINWAVNRLATQPRPIGPWERRHPEAPRRRAADYVPIAGWLGLARETVIHGERYWLRPLLVELLSAVGLMLLYWWEIPGRGLLPTLPALVVTPGVMHAQFLVHSVLIWLMATASLIDADEQIIPDSITVPGTLLGLIVAASYPPALLPIVSRQMGQLVAHPLLLTSPSNWSHWLNGPWGLAIGLGCFGLWCVALLPRTWYTRHGLRRGSNCAWPGWPARRPPGSWPPWRRRAPSPFSCCGATMPSPGGPSSRPWWAWPAAAASCGWSA